MSVERFKELRDRLAEIEQSGEATETYGAFCFAHAPTILAALEIAEKKQEQDERLKLIAKEWMIAMEEEEG